MRLCDGIFRKTHEMQEVWYPIFDFRLFCLIKITFLYHQWVQIQQFVVTRKVETYPQNFLTTNEAQPPNASCDFQGANFPRTPESSIDRTRRNGGIDLGAECFHQLELAFEPKKSSCLKKKMGGVQTAEVPGTKPFQSTPMTFPYIYIPGTP